jgi:hypothetical protein
LILLALLVVGYGGASWYLWAQQRQLIFLPSRDAQHSPADAGLRYEEVRVPVGGVSLHGWWLQADDGAAPAILYLHGNDLNLGGNVERIARLHRMGFTVLATTAAMGKAARSIEFRCTRTPRQLNYLFLQRRRSERAFITVFAGRRHRVELAPSRAAGLIVGTFTSMPGWRGPSTGCFRSTGC